MSRDEIINRLEPIFQSVFNDDELELNVDLEFGDIDEWSSLLHTVMIAEVEKEFGVSFKLREVATMNDVSALVIALENKL